MTGRSIRLLALTGLAAATCTPFATSALSGGAALPDAGTGPDAVNADAGDGGDSYAAMILADRPIGYWRFDEQGSGNVTDQVTRSLGGQVGTEPGVPGLIVDPDTAFHFDGGATVALGTDRFSFAGRASYSVEAWIRSDGQTVPGTFQDDPLVQPCETARGPRAGARPPYAEAHAPHVERQAATAEASA